MPYLLETLREFGEALVIPAVLYAAVFVAYLWRKWTKGRVKPEPRVRPEPVEAVDFGAEIAAYRIARDLREWEATRPGRAA